MSVASVSRIGRMPVIIPDGVEVKIENDKLSIKGPKGVQQVDIHPYIDVSHADNSIRVAYKDFKGRKIRSSDKKLHKSIAGTTQSNISNAIEGVTKQFEIKLKLIGVGYRAQGKGKILSLNLGFSHPTDFNVPEGITIQTPSPTEIIVQGIDKQLVGDVAKDIRAIRPPEPYKGKGVRYANEYIEIKETKKK